MNPSNKTFFRYIDINVIKYLRNRYKANIIKGSVLFNDESNNAYTIIVPGFYK